jgi:molybdopterin molybdotransferase
VFKDIRMRGFQDRREVDAVIALIDARVGVLTSQVVDLRSAAGRVLSEDMVAEVAVPAFDRAAMDGYALRGSETFGAGPYNPLEFEVIGQALPGRAFAGRVEASQAVRIMTGAAVPEGADAVLPAEDAVEGSGCVRICAAVPPGRHVGRRGEDITAGTVVLRAGRVLRPQDVAVLAAIGAAQVPVIRQPRATVVITGDELLPCGSRPEGCRIVDTNSVMVEALVCRDGGLPEVRPLVPDTPQAVRDALAGADGDIILVSGGSSVGQEDHAPQVLSELGELSIHGVAVRPAGPAGIGFLHGRPVFLLPGHPVSCLCAYDLFAGRAVRRLAGRSPQLPYRTCLLPLARKIASVVGRVDYVRVQVGENGVEPIAASGASILTSTTRADGFVLVPRDSEGHAPGEQVLVHLYD